MTFQNDSATENNQLSGTNGEYFNIFFRYFKHIFRAVFYNFLVGMSQNCLNVVIDNSNTLSTHYTIQDTKNCSL